MEKLLQWSIAQTTGDEEAKKRVGELDPELVAQLFGKMQDDPTLMKQNMFIIDSDELTLENKIVACENFEMLIENLDNAMNIENMKMWPNLIKQLKHVEDEEKKDLTKYIASIIGTLLQNNDKSQLDFLKYDDGMSKLVDIAKSEKTDTETRLKAIYALSCLLRHNVALSDKFNADISNYEIITKNLSKDQQQSSKGNVKLLLRSLSLLSAVLSSGLDDTKVEILHENGLVLELIQLLQDEESINVKDKVLNILAHDLISHGFKFSDLEKTKLKESFEKLDKSQLNEDDYDIIKQVLI